MRKLGRALWWAGPYVGVGLFAWRQQTLEANLAKWVDNTTRLVNINVRRFVDVHEQEAAESLHGIVTDGR